MGRHHDEDGDGRADQLDQQSRAYRENPDPTSDRDIASFVDRAHLSGSEPWGLPEDYEAVQWDAGREDPPVGAA